VEYETFPGWEEDITACRKISELPVNAQKYLQAIEDNLGVPISWVGVGPGREEMAVSFE
jgi:adenylosuccinate synthase